MANPYSILHNYNNVPLFNHDFEMIGNLLQAKQGNLNANRAALQNQVDQMGALDIYKDVDKNYAEERLQSVVNNVNKYAGMDLSDPGLATSLVQNLDQVMDENVKNAVYSTKLYRAEQAEWEEWRKKADGKYSEGNHAWSMQFSENWRNSQKVGDVYRGGGGFKEFVDVNEKLNKILPDIAKANGWETVKIENGGTMFREKNTYKSIPQDIIDQAIEANLGPKERQQLQINAWVKYDSIPDTELQKFYDANIDEKVAQNEKDIDYYEALLDDSKGEEYNNQLKGYIETRKSEVNNLKNSYFSKVGKESAYTSMYYEEFKTPFLNAYSRDPELVKSEVNDLDVAVFNANMKVQEFEFSKEKFAIEMDFKNKELMMKGAGKGTGKGNLQLNPKTGLYEEVASTGLATELGGDDYKEEAEDDLTLAVKQEEDALNGMKAILRAKGIPESYITNPSFIAKITSDKDYVDINVGEGKKPVRLNLRDAAISKAAQEFEVYVAGDAPVRKIAYEEIDKMSGQIQYQLAASLKNKSDDWNPQEILFNPDYKIIEDPKHKGKFITAKVDKTKVSNYFIGLLYKKGQGKKLTTLEQKNLDWYTQEQMASDTYVDKGVRGMIESSIGTNILKDVRGVGTYKLRSQAKDRAVTAALNSEFNDIQIGQLSYGDLEWGSSFSGKNPGGVDQTISSYNRVIREKVHQAMMQARMNPTQTTININKTEVPGLHQKLINKLSLPASLKDENFFLKGRKDEQGKFIGYDVMYKKEITTKKDGVSTVTISDVSTGKVLDIQSAQTIGIKADISGRPLYSAKAGKYAPTIKLGTGVIGTKTEEDLARLTRLRQQNGGTLPLENISALLDAAEARGVREEVKPYLAAAKNGQMKFDMVPGSNNTYVVKATLGNTLVGVYDLGVSDLTTDEVNEIKGTSQLLAQTAFINILRDQIIPELQTKKSLR